MARRLDLVVVGSGIAGLTAAVRAASAGLTVGVVTKGAMAQTATAWAQGGVAAVIGQVPDDSLDLHLEDTMRAGAGLCDEQAVRVLVGEGPARVRELMELGARFDRDPDGALQLAVEGGHSRARVVHAGGAATGSEIERALVVAVGRTAAAVHEHAFAVDLLVRHGRCWGVRVVRDGRLEEIEAEHVLLATGGAGQLFALTTNPLEATGDGVAMALRAGVPVADLEFVQFHPTALAVDRLPRPLLSEALRGHGALLRDQRGQRFVDELLPRDIVSRAITAQMLETGLDHVWLDASAIADFAVRYPSIDRVLREVGLDPAHDWLPVAPAAHYICGGVVTDLDGATATPGLWAAGEVTCSGVNGANRLASNSLLEGLVFGARVVDGLLAGKSGPDATGAMRCVLEPEGTWPGRRASLPVRAHDGSATRAELQRAMTLGAGVLRDASSLMSASGVAARTRDHADPEVRNLGIMADAVVTAALLREESRGAHARIDFPDRDDAWRARVVIGRWS